MTRKDYIVIAAALYAAHEQADEQEQPVVESVANKVAEHLANAYPNFDRITFLKACVSA